MCLSIKGAQAWEFWLACFTLSELIWVCDLGTGKITNFCFLNWPLILMVFDFLPHTECKVNKKKFVARPKLKVGGGCFWAHIQCFFWKSLNFLVFIWMFKNSKKSSFSSEHSVWGQKFLPPTQYAENNFFHLPVLSMRAIISTAYSEYVKRFLMMTQYAWNKEKNLRNTVMTINTLCRVTNESL